MTIDNYLQSVRKQFQYYKVLGERTFDQLRDADLFWQYNEESNSIAITVNHLHGNMLSRWTDFLTTDGEKDWRDREAEFHSSIQSRAILIDRWEEGWSCLFTALDTLNQESIELPVYIRNQQHTIYEAINRQMMHYAYHVGQIVYIGRMIRGSEWQSLSIPKGQSAAFNASKQVKGKHGGHFTDDIKENGAG